MSHVNANYDILAPRWEHDEIAVAMVRERIWSLYRAGLTQHDIARRVGCSSRTVARTLKK